MKILLYSANFAPEPTGIGKYSGEMAEWLAARGHDVRVVCAPPYYPAWQLDERYRWPPWRHETWRGVRVWRAPLWVPRRPGGLKRVLHLCTFALSSLPVMLRQTLWRPDVVLTDVVMPGGMSGKQLADAALAERPGLRVLFTSGYAEDAIVHNGRLDPGVRLLGKPYRRGVLARTLREVLDA